ncbi:hypothetical protein [Luteolibacter sp. AS25]|uniref:hypothetical protein n=1 Tax=Luteolibacter sp. AS25 TaxID=3135776 RepID=UPI00398B5886
MNSGEGNFAETALEVFAHQFTYNIPYRRYCEALGITPENTSSWLEIPAVPTDVFKLPEVGLRCFPESEVSGYFLTSGTTREIKGKHEHRSLTLYKASVFSAWHHLSLPPIRQPWFFSQRLGSHPHSSLVQMFDFLDLGGQWLIDEYGNFHPEKFSPEGTPAAILGTSITLMNACEVMEPLTLPPDSWIFETGGSKGLRENFTPAQVREKLSTHFGLPLSRILNEYSMTELSSQFYKWGNQETHKGPPWTAIRIVDLETGNPAPLGAIGYLEIIDLANIDTVSAIRTQDLAIATGEREFQLIGRDPAAIARGCSRMS